MALAEVIDGATSALGSSEADLAILFVSQTFASEFPRILPLLRDRVKAKNLIGCGAGGVIGSCVGGAFVSRTEEIETLPALSLTLANLPAVDIRTFHVTERELPDLDAAPDQWWTLAGGVKPDSMPAFIMFADPTTGQLTDLLRGFDYAFPQSVKLGGIGTGGVFHNGQLKRGGVVGMALSGDIEVCPIVAQGCRPIGDVLRVTEAEGNVLMKLNDMPALEAIRVVVEALPPEERALAQNSLYIGLCGDEFKENIDRSDFLVRDVLGVDPRNGAIAVGATVRAGQRMQFHIRDAASSAEDLTGLLERFWKITSSAGEASEPVKPIGSLMVSCLGRGEGLYGVPNHDSTVFHRFFPSVPVSGFFASGEIGGHADTTYLHGYTSVFGVII